LTSIQSRSFFVLHRETSVMSSNHILTFWML